MFEIPQAYGIPGIIIALVITPDCDTDHFQIKASVLQGDTLAPFLFIIVLDYIMRHALKDIQDSIGIIIEEIYPEMRLHDLDFAYDIVDLL